MMNDKCRAIYNRDDTSDKVKLNDCRVSADNILDVIHDGR